MKKSSIIKKNNEFSRIINKGKNIKTKFYSIYYMPNEKSLNMYGISIPTKTGNAVVRNKIKRQIKNIIDINETNIIKYFDYVIIVRKEILNISFEKRKEELIKMLGEIK